MKQVFFKFFIAVFLLLNFAACKRGQRTISQTHVNQIVIDSSIIAADSMDTFIQPYRSRLNEVLDAPLSYAPRSITKTEGKWNTPLGNLMADLMLDRANAIALKRGEQKADLALLNFGGMRASISKGPVSERTAYEVMPFENGLVVVGMPGRAIKKMVGFLTTASRPHPVSGIEIILRADGSLKSARIQGQPIDDKHIYYIATSDYLMGGGDRMDFFSDRVSISDTGYKIRNAMVDYFKTIDTLHAETDNRFIQLDSL
ncbi:5'-nucleotidase C-terminal domain-containing protein [Robiginitalea sp.]|uniref:5'-nucleotidase C-terminal domain-containing protein n=1 Tax=Robiginitalea sp. TaxID=1902411 RepID=UPI003C76C706